jgi:excisionase family DNA binding protein
MQEASGPAGRPWLPIGGRSVPVAKDHEVLNVKELMEWLRISEATAYRKLESGEIPARKIGKLWRIHKAEAEAWLRQSRQGEEEKRKEAQSYIKRFGRR